MSESTITLPKKEVPKKLKRVPVSGNRDVLTVKDKEPGYVYRFVNNVEDRVAKFMDGGYEIVRKHQAGEIGDPRVDTSSGTSSIVEKGVGLGTKAVLMRIKEEFYNEDQEAKKRYVDEIEAAMKRDAKEGRYGDIKISRGPSSDN